MRKLDSASLSRAVFAKGRGSSRAAEKKLRSWCRSGSGSEGGRQAVRTSAPQSPRCSRISRLAEMTAMRQLLSSPCARGMGRGSVKTPEVAFRRVRFRQAGRATCRRSSGAGPHGRFCADAQKNEVHRRQSERDEGSGGRRRADTAEKRRAQDGAAALSKWPGVRQLVRRTTVIRTAGGIMPGMPQGT